MASLSLKSVIKKYLNGSVAVKEFNLEITGKELIISVGPSGCGKSITPRIIAGLENISSGEPYIDDKLANDVEPRDRDIAMVFQNYALYPRMSVHGNMVFSLKLRKTSKDEIDKKAYDVAKVLDLEHLLDRKLGAFSDGQRQHVAMGRAIVRNPKAFLMDESLSNLDAKLRRQIRVEISKLYQRLETTIIYVTHDQAETMILGTRIVVMKDDIVQQVNSPWSLYNKPCSKFVAGFTGTPQMNMIGATVDKGGAPTALSFGGHTIVLSEAKSKKLEDAGYIEEAATLDIRPEGSYDEESYLAMSSESILEAIIRICGILGSEVLLYFGIENANLVARINPRTTARLGDVIKLAMDLERIHIFDKDTELTVLN